MAKAWQQPDTIVVHEPFWNALARNSDIVLPATTTLERDDIGGSGMDDFIFWMAQAIEPVGDARNDYDIFADLAERLDAGERFTEGRTSEEWLEHLYERFHAGHPDYPTLDELKDAGHFEIPSEWLPPVLSQLVAFREDPVGSALKTPSGRIELYSETIEGFGYPDCPPYPSWLEPAEWLGAEVRSVDASLLEEWEAMRNPTPAVAKPQEEELPEDIKKKEEVQGTRGESNLRGHLKGEFGEDKEEEVSGSSSYVPEDKEKDTQLQYALDILRGIKSVDTEAEKKKAEASN